VAPVTIAHQGLFPAVTLSFNLAPGVALGDAVIAIQNAEQAAGMPATVKGSFQGAAQAFQASLSAAAAADPGRRGHDLHRAGRAVRKRDPSAHDPPTCPRPGWGRCWR
jgi:hypothetical protein